MRIEQVEQMFYNLKHKKDFPFSTHFDFIRHFARCNIKEKEVRNVEEDKIFLAIVKSDELRPILLARLQSLGLLAAFLRAESETTQEA